MARRPPGSVPTLSTHPSTGFFGRRQASCFFFSGCRGATSGRGGGDFPGGVIFRGGRGGRGGARGGGGECGGGGGGGRLRRRERPEANRAPRRRRPLAAARRGRRLRLRRPLSLWFCLRALRRIVALCLCSRRGAHRFRPRPGRCDHGRRRNRRRRGPLRRGLRRSRPLRQGRAAARRLVLQRPRGPQPLRAAHRRWRGGALPVRAARRKRRRRRKSPHAPRRRRGGPARLPRAHGRGQGRHGGAHHQLAGDDRSRARAHAAHHHQAQPPAPRRPQGPDGARLLTSPTRRSGPPSRFNARAGVLRYMSYCDGGGSAVFPAAPRLCACDGPALWRRSRSERVCENVGDIGHDGLVVEGSLL
mmetsp:Transcript_24090/g.81210  ORF Transcript_24090/g.81210 Transcript_24090/m.81210 type:complete len:360 (+) Transcript_24090:1619-2698(+)